VWSRDFIGCGGGFGKLQLYPSGHRLDAETDIREADNPEVNRLDILYGGYIIHSLQHRWLLRNASLDLQQDRGLPVVQLHDLIVFHNGCGECLLIICF